MAEPRPRKSATALRRRGSLSSSSVFAFAFDVSYTTLRGSLSTQLLPSYWAAPPPHSHCPSTPHSPCTTLTSKMQEQHSSTALRVLQGQQCLLKGGGIPGRQRSQGGLSGLVVLKAPQRKAQSTLSLPTSTSSARIERCGLGKLLGPAGGDLATSLDISVLSCHGAPLEAPPPLPAGPQVPQRGRRRCLATAIWPC